MKNPEFICKILFVFVLNCILLASFPLVSFAIYTNEQYASSTYLCSDWFNISNSLGAPDFKYATITTSIPTCRWNYVNSFNIPLGSTINSITVKIYASNSGTLGISSMSPSYNGTQSCIPPPFWPATLSNGITEYVVNQANCATMPTIDKLNSSNMSWSFFNSGQVNMSLDSISMKVDYNPLSEHTPTPFLDLPWDYEDKGMSFSEAALSINSYFDHEYPLLGFTNLSEPATLSGTLITYKGGPRNTDLWYSSHNGYDYGTRGGAKVTLRDDVLAAASGTAQFINSCANCGNMVVIDHDNGYQTKYMHLLDTGLISSTPGATMFVTRGQKIGEVGSTGNSSGAHIHFGVYQDKNDDGDFNDNVIDGLTDPFGWRSDEPDPWENYPFTYLGTERTGNKSYYLWINSLGEKTETLTKGPKFFTIGQYQFNFQEDTTEDILQLDFSPEPTFFSKIHSSVGTTLSAKAKNSSGHNITEFSKPFTLTVDFNSADLSRINPNTLSIYSSQDKLNWTKEITELDLTGKKASANLSHFTYFALLGERKDAIAPTTDLMFSGNEGNDNWFRSNVEIALNANDNEGGLGVNYTAYKIENGNWQKYESPLIFTDEGNYGVSFYSEDKDGNVEEIKSVEFNIDKTPPEAEIKLNLNSLDIDITGHDNFNATHITTSDLPKDRKMVHITDNAGNVLKILQKDKDQGRNAKLAIETLQYNQEQIINLDPTKLSVNYNTNVLGLNIKSFEQKFEIKGELKIKLDYRAKTGKTEVKIKENGHEKVKEEVRGIRILTVTTQKGNLNYSY